MAFPALTDAQMTILVQDVAADPALRDIPHNSDTAILVADVYNQGAVPDFWAKRWSVTKEEYVTGVGPEGTTFIWAGNGFIGRTPGEHTAWQELFDNEHRVVNPSRGNIQQAFQDIFSGAGNAAANRAHLDAMSRRLITRFERLYTTGSGAAATPGQLAVHGPLLPAEVEEAWNQEA